MSLAFHNTMTRAIEEFKPITPGEARLYTCGPTVYDNAHIGNFRTYAFEDVLRRYLKYRGFQVTQVMNITDVEDKIIRAHRAQHKSIGDITAPFIEAFFTDLDTLNIERAEKYPRATEYVPQMVEMVHQLLEKGYAYRSEDGSIYYDISKFPPYGSLAHFNLEDLVAGARVKQDEYEKASASDFALWKAWDPEDGDVAWETSLGKGRPGWHLECSAMSMSLLGEQFDIHTGGEDNIFPHHENEIAQSEATTGKKFVNYWLHSRHLLVDHGKMSKSKGNFYTVRELWADRQIPWYALRYLYISSHYRSLLNFTLESVQQSQNTVQNLFGFMQRLGEIPRGADGEPLPAVKDATLKAQADFEKAMDNDLSTPDALAAVQTLVRQSSKFSDEGVLKSADAKQIADLLTSLDRVLGLKLHEHLQPPSLEAEIESKIREREAARKAKDFKLSDKIRDDLKQQGIILEDTPGGVRWKKA